MAAMGDVLADRYELQAQLGRGGMAEVFRALDTRLGRQVAVKVLADAMLADPRSVDRFRREARAAASLNHPHIVNVYDAASDGDVHFIVMELLEGPTLADRIRTAGRLSPAEALPIAADVADALDAAHRRGLVHHDVKPRNVLFDAEGAAKVADFGIARAASSAITTIQGSPPYVAPEQARGGQADPRSDIYALGCTLFEMLAGRPPFTGDSASQVIMQHIDAPRPHVRDLADGVSPEVDAVIHRALSRDPADRQPSAAALRDQLRRAAAGLDDTEAQRVSTMLLPADATTAVPAGDGTIYGQSYARYEPEDDSGDTVGAPVGQDYTRRPPPRRRSRARTVLLSVALLLLVLVAAAAWADGRFDSAPADDTAVAPDVEPAPEEPAPEPAPDGDAGDGGGIGGAIGDRLQDLLDRGRDAAADQGERAVERLQERIAEEIRQQAEDATQQQLDALRDRVDEAVDNGRIGEALGEQLRGIIDDAVPSAG